MWKVDPSQTALMRQDYQQGSSESCQGTETRQAVPLVLIYQPSTVTMYRVTPFSRLSARAAGQASAERLKPYFCFCLENLSVEVVYS